MLDLLPVGIFFAIDQSDEVGVIWEFDNSVAGVELGTVVCEKQGAEDTSLWCTSVHGDGGGDTASYTDIV